MMCALTLHISWSIHYFLALCYHIWSKNTTLFIKITLTKFQFNFALYFYIWSKSTHLFRKVQRKLTLTVTKWLFHCLQHHWNLWSNWIRHLSVMAEDYNSNLHREALSQIFQLWIICIIIYKTRQMSTKV